MVYITRDRKYRSGGVGLEKRIISFVKDIEVIGHLMNTVDIQELVDYVEKEENNLEKKVFL